MAISSRWVGASISPPGGPAREGRPSAIGRQYYGAVEITRTTSGEDAGEEISVDDVVQIVGGDDTLGIDSSINQAGDSGRRLRLGQVGRQ